MARRKETMILPHLNDRNGDVSKPWYVEYSFRNPSTGVMDRPRIYKGLDGPDSKERYKRSEEIIKDLEKKLSDGKNPNKQKEDLVKTSDETLYHNASFVTGRTIHVKKNGIVLYINEYLLYKKQRIDTEKSYREYQSRLRAFKQYLDLKKLSEKDISEIEESHIETFLIGIQKAKDLSDVTIKKYRQIIYGMFDFAIKKKKVMIPNPAACIENFGTIKDQAPDPISERHRKIFARVIPKQDPQLWLACMFMYYTALRPGEEIRLLLIRQLNFETKSVTVLKTMAKNTERETLRLPDHFVTQLLDVYHLDQYPADFYVFGKNGGPGPEHIGKNNMRNRFYRIRDALKMPKTYTFYAWKYTGASSLIASGANIFEVQSHLRHKDIQTTMHYIRKHLGYNFESIIKKFPKI